MHALRGSGMRGYIWALLHCPLQCSIIASSVAFKFFIDSTLQQTNHGGSQEDVVGQQIEDVHRELFSISNGGIILSLFVIACLHVPRPGKVIARKVRMAIRLAGTIALFVMHLAGSALSPLGMMTYTGFWLFGLACLDM